MLEIVTDLSKSRLFSNCMLYIIATDKGGNGGVDYRIRTGTGYLVTGSRPTGTQNRRVYQFRQVHDPKGLDDLSPRPGRLGKSCLPGLLYLPPYSVTLPSSGGRNIGASFFS